MGNDQPSGCGFPHVASWQQPDAGLTLAPVLLLNSKSLYHDANEEIGVPQTLHNFSIQGDKFKEENVSSWVFHICGIRNEKLRKVRSYKP